MCFGMKDRLIIFDQPVLFSGFFNQNIRNYFKKTKVFQWVEKED